MKIYVIGIAMLMLAMGCSAPVEEQENKSLDPKETFQGAWTTRFTNDQGLEVKAVALITDGYLSESLYHPEAKRFDYTRGGKWHIKDSALVIEVEYHSSDSSQVGQSLAYIYSLSEDTLTFEGYPHIWTRIDGTSDSPLAGAWLITGRMQGEDTTYWTPGSRKTMKILTDTRFQWIAYDVDKAGFYGTGGGQYSLTDSTYTEHITFFSRDSSRVGADLDFKYNIENGKWHHSGLSSKGQPIFEVWTPRMEVE